MAGLVLEGGAFRGLFTCGVLDALLDENLMFPYTIGVSSGTSYGMSYVSRQKGRNLKVTEFLAQDKNYVNIKNYFLHKSILNTRTAFTDIPDKIYPFDFETFYNTPERFITVACDASNLKPHYYEKEEMDRHGVLVQGSCALPPFVPTVTFKGKTLVDGGLGDPIPLTRSEKDGNISNLVVLTKPYDYNHHFRWDERLLAAYYSIRNVNASGWMRMRHNNFNATFERCRKEDGKGNIISLYIKNEHMISRFENDLDKLRALYHDGYESTMKRLDEIKDLLLRK